MTDFIEINEETLQDIINIETGLLHPLQGFMNEADFRGVVDTYLLSDGQVFTIPVTLDVPEDTALKYGQTLHLSFCGKHVADMEIEDTYHMTDADIEKVFRTLDMKHPGVKKEKERSPLRVGGKTTLLDKTLLEDALKPEKTKKIFADKGWKTVVGFQTRNPIHKAHEHLQRIGLEVCDGLFINPIIGWKKKGDFTQEAVVAAYERMVEEFYPKNSVYMEGLKTQMRYAGPREAVFHAIIRRNLGCTHFIIGRDHAGVGGFYGAYDAHALARELSEKYDLGIQLLLLHEPYYCKKCGMVVSEKNCSHYETDRVEISGTIIRKYINDGAIPDEIMLRKEIFEAILNCGQIFIE
ncbi:MAG: sulfate adenylyltransferase [Lachnospiraceae bacterium]|nr:sulfate adenylyltransferase [Lachnospiraceae bacterium]